MTRVEMRRTDAGNALIVDGHQDGEEYGKNIYCAAVGSMVACLRNALIREGVSSEFDCRDGHVEVRAGRGERLDAFFDAAVSGFLGMQQEYPERLGVTLNGQALLK